MNKLKNFDFHSLCFPFLLLGLFLLNNPALLAADLVLATQSAVDAFNPVDGIHEGDLRISGNDILDLSNLSSLTEVTGDFSISDNPLLTNLNGLENLQKIGINLVIANNPVLSQLTSLVSLTTVGNSLFIIENDGLSDLSGLDGVQSDLIELNILQNDLLLNIDALQGISRVGSSIQILLNPELRTIDGLANIDQFCSEVLLESNPKLEQINGLSAIRVGTRLTLVNLNITNIDPLSHMTNAILNLVIASNAALVNVDGLSNLGVNNSFVLADNPQLATCCGAFPLFTNFSSIPSNLTIQNNLPGCNSLEEILEDCGLEGCNGPINISSQSEMDAFPDCTTLFGSIFIDGADITDLSPMSNLQMVTGSINIVNTGITSLAGLENLTTVGKTLAIVNCDLIPNLIGLDNLTTVNESFNIVQNDLLVNFTGLSTLTGSVGTYVVFDNPMLTDFTGPSFSEIFNSIYIARNPMLTNVDPLLSVVDTVGNFITLEFNEGMTSITGLQHIPYTREIRIIGMNSLENLDGLQGISGAIELLVIPINDVLTDISALSNLTSVAVLTIANNPLLNDCCGVAQVLDDPNSQVLITDNLADCASENAVLSFCGFPACNGDVTFDSQAQLDAWIPCDTLFGNLELMGEDITDLSPLNGLVAITGNLTIDGCTNLTSLQGLNQLQYVGGTLLFSQNDALTDFFGLEQLETIGQNLEIIGNDNIGSLQGLQGLMGTLDDLVLFGSISK
ncbi:MAG: hypothetical protein AAF985_21245, partial [Bacteroidota bacterium]